MVQLKQLLKICADDPWAQGHLHESPLFFAGDSLTAFTATLLIGVLFGTFSSIFVAAPLLIALQRKGKALIDPPAVVVSEDQTATDAEPETSPKG